MNAQSSLPVVRPKADSHWPMAVIAILLALGLTSLAPAADEELVKAFQSLDTQIVPAAEREAFANQVREQQRSAIRKAHGYRSVAWREIKNRSGWERFRQQKLVALKKSRLLKERARDVAELREHPDLRGRRITLWAESLTPPNPETARFHQPRDDDAALPAPFEPQTPLLALLAGLFEDDISTIYTVGDLTSWRALLADDLVLTAYASIVPGALTAGDIPDLIGTRFVLAVASASRWPLTAETIEFLIVRNEPVRPSG